MDYCVKEESSDGESDDMNSSPRKGRPERGERAGVERT